VDARGARQLVPELGAPGVQALRAARAPHCQDV